MGKKIFAVEKKNEKFTKKFEFFLLKLMLKWLFMEKIHVFSAFDSNFGLAFFGFFLDPVWLFKSHPVVALRPLTVHVHHLSSIHGIF